MLQKIKSFVRKEIILSTFTFLLLLLAICFPAEIPNYLEYIDWQTIIAISGLLIITAGLKESKYFNLVVRRILKKFKNERKLAFFLVLFSAFLSTFLTNDVALFVIIPLIFTIQSSVKNDISKIIIFVAIAVNVGSALTPIGNPQNLFLWHQWEISFFHFILQMLPMVLLQLIFLLLFIAIIFPRKGIQSSTNAQNNNYSKPLFLSSLFLMLVYIVAIELKQDLLILPIVALFYFFAYRNVLKEVDWILILIFTIIFIDFGILSNIPFLQRVTRSLVNFNSSGDVFLFSAAISQVISNVPASVFVAKFSNNWFAVTYGVNAGGNGIVIASLANIIALRLSRNKKVWLEFHKYSIPFLLITAITLWGMFYFSIF